MILIFALLLAGTLPLTAQAPDTDAASRLLRLPDVILSAEDPLYLAPPRPAAWLLDPVGQPPPDRLRLYGVNYPPLIRESLRLPPVPAGVPVPRPTAPPAGSAGPSQGAGIPQGATGGISSVPEDPAGGELSAGIRYSPIEAVWTEVELDRRFEDWTLEGNGRLELYDALLGRESWEPSYARLSLKAVRAAEPWSANIAAEATAALAPRSSVLAACGLTAGFLVDTGRLRFRSRTDFLGEDRPDRMERAALLAQELLLSWSGPVLGFYGSAAGSVLGKLPDRSLEPQGLAHIGLTWTWEQFPLRVCLGGAVLWFQDSVMPFPEAQVEFQPWPGLKLQAEAGPFLEPPVSFLFRTANDSTQLPVLGSQAGRRARAALQFEARSVGSIRIDLQADEGYRYRISEGILSWGEASELAAAAESNWIIVKPALRRPEVALRAGASASLPLPLPAEPLHQLLTRSAEGGLRIGFPKPALELIMQAHWGNFPLEAQQSLITERLGLSSAWAASAQVRWTMRNIMDWILGAELREAKDFRMLLGCTTRRRR